MDIVEEIRNNREKGARRLESEYKAGLMALARRFCPDEGDAEELVNSTFAEVVSSIDRYAEQSAFFAWMARILVRRHGHDTERKSNKSVALAPEIAEVAADPAAESRIFREVDASILRDAIQDLPQEIRNTVVMHYFMDIPVREAAKVLSVPTGTVAWRLHYARMLLAAKLGAAAKKPGVKALLVVIALAALTAAGAAIAGARAARPQGANADEPSSLRQDAAQDWTGGTGGTEGTDETSALDGASVPPVAPVPPVLASIDPLFPTLTPKHPQTQEPTMKYTSLLATPFAASALAVQAVAPAIASTDTTPRPMALMIMVDGLRADAVETAYMPNLAKLRNGEWQPGYNCAWSLDAQLALGASPAAGPNYVSIATGVGPSKHKVTSNNNMAGGDYANYPTWLARVVGADPAKSAYFLSTWANNASIGPTNTVTTTVNASDAENASNLAAILASASAPDATMYFIEAPDVGAKTSGFFPMGNDYRSSLMAADGYVAQCLDAIAGRPTFADEDWLILLTSGYGGYAKTHTDIVNGRHAHTVPLIIAGRNVTSGRIPGQPSNMDVAASALAHFGVTVSGLDAVVRDNLAIAEPSLALSDGLAAYLPFDSSATANAAAGSFVAPTSNGSVALAGNGMFGRCLDFPAGTGTKNFVKLLGSDTGSLAYGNGNTCFAATLWVKMSPPAFDPPIVANKTWSGNGKGFLLFGGSSSQIKYPTINGVNPCLGGFVNAGNGSARIDMGCMDFEGTNDWSFYAITRNADGVITLYQGRNDGTLDWVSGTLSGFTLESGCPFYIGNDASENYYNGQQARAFVGAVDDFGLWTRALTHGEIRRIFSAGHAGIPLGTLASTSSGPETATWTGASSSDPTFAGNWSDYTVPTFDTAVVVPGTATRPIAMGASFPCKSVFFDNAMLAADIGEPGFDATKIVPGSLIDLNGHVLRLRAGTAYLPFAVTDSSADAAHPGELHLDDTGIDIVNTTMAVSGNLRFFKSGAGTFTASASATYTGGISVEGGTFVMARAVSGSLYVGAGATLDHYGYSFSANPLTLAGGTITSTKKNVGSNLPAAITLTADSSIVHDHNGSNHDISIPANAVWNLGGKTLTVSIEGSDCDFNMESGSTITNGTLRFDVKTTTYNPEGKAWVAFANLNGRDGLNFDLGASILRMKWAANGGTTVNSTVHDFTCDPLPGTSVFSAHTLEVYGAYTPPSTSMGFNTMLMDGAALNLASASVPWDCAYANVGGSAGGDKVCALSFGDGATITVNLAGRTDLYAIASERGLVATWATGKVPSASTTFVLDPETAALPHEYYLRKTSEGLSLRKVESTTIFIR